MKEKGIATSVIVIIVIAVVVVAGISAYFLTGSEGEGEEEEQPSVMEFQFVRKIEVGTGIFYPAIIFTNNHFYVSYESGRRVHVKVYDENFTATGEEHQLTSKEGADHQMVFGDGYFYLVDSFDLKKFDSNWNEIKSVSVFDNLPPEASQHVSGEAEEGLDDMLLYYADGSLYLGMIGNLPHGEGEKLDILENLFIREYDQNLELKNELMLIDVGNVAGSSMILRNGIFTIVCSDRKWDDSSLIVVRYDENWNFLDSKAISAVSGANEEFAMGSLFENGIYFVCYQHITGDLSQPVSGEPVRRVDVMLKAFDSDWNLMGQTMVTDDVPESALADHARAPHLAWAGNKIYVSYAAGSKIFVKEYTIVS